MINSPTLFLGVIGALLLSELQAASVLKNNDEQDNRIMGGQDAERRQFPYTVSIQYKGQFHICGASILTPLWIISAGHCFDTKLLPAHIYPNLVHNLEAAAGLLNQGESHPDVQRIHIQQIISHPGYNYNGIEIRNDIALAKLDSPLKFTQAVQPIGIPQEGQHFQGTAVVDGWGSYIRPETYPTRLQYLKMRVITNAECKDTINRLAPGLPLLDEMICTAPFELYDTACHGDSGGPLAQNNVLIGIASWVLDCTKPLKDSPSVFTRVSYYIDFIKEYIPDV